MKEFIKNWLFKDDVERHEWYFIRRKDELDSSYQDRSNYLEQKYKAIERENELMKQHISNLLKYRESSLMLSDSNDEKPQ